MTQSSPRPRASWERVLSAIEADTARAQALLASDDALTSAGIEYDGHGGLPATRTPMPATWRLPSNQPGAVPTAFVAAGRGGDDNAIQNRFAAGIPASGEAVPLVQPSPMAQASPPPDLPPMADLPPLDESTRARLEELHGHITALQSELTLALAEAEELLARTAPRRAPVADARPELIDQRA